MVLHVGRSRPIETVRHPWRRRFGERRDVEAISFCGAAGLPGARSQPEYGRLRSSPGSTLAKRSTLDGPHRRFLEQRSAGVGFSGESEINTDNALATVNGVPLGGIGYSQ